MNVHSDPDHDRERAKPPVEPIPPDAAELPSRRSSGVAGWLVLGGGLVLLLGVLLVLFWPASRKPVAPSMPVPAERASGPPAVTEPAAAPPPQLARLRRHWLQQQAAAEAENISAWGGESYRQAVGMAAECERLAGEKRYATAVERCTAASARLEALLAGKPQLLQDALERGSRALASGNAEAAAEAFRLALQVDPENRPARAGSARAERLPEVLRLSAAAKEQEAAGNLAEARRLFAEALALDERFVPVRDGLARIEAALAAEGFRRAMSRALRELNAGRFAAAGRALDEAAGLRPQDPAVGELRRQLEQARLTARLEQLRRRARQEEGRESWVAALKTCEQALKLDPAAAFAVSCRQRSRLRLELDQRLEQTLARPQRLFENGPLTEARRLLEEASRVSSAGPRLRGQQERLRQLIREAETEVEVLLSSDGLTEIQIYHVGRLGRFREKRLKLRTGDYTAVGSRDGYRDVRRVLRVRPGSGTLQFDLRCEEPI